MAKRPKCRDPVAVFEALGAGFRDTARPECGEYLSTCRFRADCKHWRADAEHIASYRREHPDDAPRPAECSYPGCRAKTDDRLLWGWIAAPGIPGAYYCPAHCEAWTNMDDRPPAQLAPKGDG